MLPDVLVGVDEVVLGAEVARVALQRRLVERDRSDPAELTASERSRLLGVAAQDPELGIVGEARERVLDGAPILLELLLFLRDRGFRRRHLLGAQRDVCALGVGNLGRAALCLREGLLRGGVARHVLLGARQSEPAHRALAIGAQGLMERARRLDPHEVVQIGEPLVVEAPALAVTTS